VWSPQSRPALIKAIPYQPIQLCAARAVLAAAARDAAPFGLGAAAAAELERLRGEVAASEGELARVMRVLGDLRQNVYLEVDKVRGSVAFRVGYSSED
jgi:hypothetical protein